MTFDWGGFAGGVIGTIGAFAVAFFTLRYQEKKEKPVINKRKYRLLIDVVDLIRNSGYEVLVFQEERTLAYCINLVRSFSYEIEKLLPDAIEVDLELHDIIKQTSNAMDDLISAYYEYIHQQSNEDPNLIQKFCEEYKQITLKYIGIYGDEIRKVVRQANSTSKN